MLNTQNELSTIAVPLGLTAHIKAKKLSQYQSGSTAKQVYLNTLAVYAVNTYLENREFDTDLEKCLSWRSRMQGLLNIADLVVKDCGILECRPVLPNAETFHVPPEVWSDRIGYVAVQLDESLREATILGFVEKVSKSEISLNELRSLDEFPAYLNQLMTVKTPVNLSQWLSQIFDAGWEKLETLFVTPQPQLAFNFRQRSPKDLQRGKLLLLGELNELVALVVGITEIEEGIFDISVEVYPTNSLELPPQLMLIVLDETDKLVMQAKAGENSERLEFQFNGEVGEQFSVKVCLSNFTVIEKFLL